MKKGKHIFVKTAIEAIENYINSGIKIHKKEPTDEELKERKGCFVSIHNINNQLRGCMGTIEPMYVNLYHEIVENAIAASTRDPRFVPIINNELSSLYVTVNTVSTPELCEIKDLNPKKYGLIISYKNHKGVLLPDLEGIDTVEQQINIVKHKAGIKSVENDLLTFYKFESTHYS